MEDEYRESLLKSPKKYRYNLVQMYMEGQKIYRHNLQALIKSKNNF